MSNIKFVEGDLFAHLNDYAETSVYLAHIVNSCGAFGAGFVLPLGRRFPQAKQSYLDWYKDRDKNSVFPEFSLGRTLFVKVDTNLTVCHMLAQELGGARPLYYNHLARCMDAVADTVSCHKPAHIICPFFGCDLAGGDFAVIEKLIEDCWLRPGLAVTVYYLPGRAPITWRVEQQEASDDTAS